MDHPFNIPYKVNIAFPRRIAYFCMEFAIDQPLKTYAGGLGFLAGSHLRSAYELKLNMIGVGILWKYGYYDQEKNAVSGMDVRFNEKHYGFLERTEIRLLIKVNGHKIQVAVFYLPPNIFQTAPLFLLSTDLPENDYLSRTICHKLYDSNPETRIAAAILLGDGGAKLLEQLNWSPDVYHLNESHALPLAFHLYKKFGNLDDVKKRLIFTNHTPEPGGNEKTAISLLERMGFFLGLSRDEINMIAFPSTDTLDHTLTALRLSSIANGVSKMHLRSLQAMWRGYNRICRLISVTNAQSFSYWHDAVLYRAMERNDDAMLISRKSDLKKNLFKEIADQCGEIYDDAVLTIVFARRFGGYKRPELLLTDMARFKKIVENRQRPVQLIWAGKPHPMDQAAINLFNNIANVCNTYANCSIMVGYELRLSRLLKQGADIWLNVPRITHEASGTSGMSAAMNGALNMSIPDGWFPEFAKDGLNSFVISPADPSQPEHLQDEADAKALYDLLEQKVIPLYYDDHAKWLQMIKQSMTDIIPQLDSNRMVLEYYKLMYSAG